MSTVNNPTEESHTSVMTCKNCRAELFAVPELHEDDWILDCFEFECGAKNLVEARLQVVGWRL
jgi:hypothetical protein